MTINKNEKIIARILSITIIIYAFFGNVHYCCFNENFYTKEHEKITLYGKPINEHIGITKEELKELTSFTLHYLNDTKATLDKKMNINGVEREVFTDDEKAHMVDVRNLNLNSVYLCIVSFIVFVTCFLVYLYKKGSLNNLYRNYKYTLLNVLIIFGIIGFWVLVDFNSFWTLFHKIFFTGNDLWILDLRKDILIMIVPPEFFNHLVIRIIINFIANIFIFGLLLLVFSRKKKASND